MEPTIRPGDLLLIDLTAASRPLAEAIYVLRLDDAVLVKRLQPLGKGRVLAVSDNPRHQARELGEHDGVQLVGRVAALVKRA